MKPTTNEPAAGASQSGQGDDPRLSFDQCWELLDSETVGRLALVVDEHPEIFPVNYVLDNRTIVFRTGRGRKLWGAMAMGRLFWKSMGTTHEVRRPGAS